MSLKRNLINALEQNLQNNSTSRECADRIVGTFKDSFEKGKDVFGNNFSGIEWSLVTASFEQTFRNSVSLKTGFSFRLITLALNTSFATIRVQQPAKLPPGFSFVSNLVFVGSTFSDKMVPILPGNTNSLDKLATLLDRYFKTYCSLISFQYVGLNIGTPPTPLILPQVGIKIY